MIRTLEPARDADACDAIVRGLPGWFGLEEGIEECAAAVRSQDGLVRFDHEDELLGFLTFEPRTDTTWEITWMAVHPDRRGTGVGRSLVEALGERLPAAAGSIVVKTLSDRDGDPGPEYRATRAFYLAMGFTPVAELDIWGPGNPCQLLSRTIDRSMPA